jgi:hypothetical protein
MITQSFKVRDIYSGVTCRFLIDENCKWISETIDTASVVWEALNISQEDANIAYNYFTSHWQDYDVTLIELAH